jgi:hypothetical protein
MESGGVQMVSSRFGGPNHDEADVLARGGCAKKSTVWRCPLTISLVLSPTLRLRFSSWRLPPSSSVCHIVQLLANVSPECRLERSREDADVV